MGKCGDTLHHRAGFIENIHEPADHQDKQNDVDAVVNTFHRCLQDGYKPLPIPFLRLKSIWNGDRLADIAGSEFFQRNPDAQAVEGALCQRQGAFPGRSGDDEMFVAR